MGVHDWKKEAIRQDSTLVGRRMWALQRDRERWRLANIAHFYTNNSGEWPRGVSEAECDSWQRHRDRGPSPNPGCHCGLYAFWSQEELDKQRHTGLVSGIVWAWGRVLPGNEGFVSQYMMVRALDWPFCGFTTYSEPKPCGKPAEHMVSSPRWTEPYPGVGDEDAEVGFEWVNCRLEDSQTKWLCDKHREQDKTLVASTQQRIIVPVSKVIDDLARWYEPEVLPGIDFSVQDAGQKKP